jgi:Reverse transcriptase (RNA-dependent DNA polymerase)
MCLDAMSGARWFSTFDLRSSYHQVPVVTKDADKTAFICREGMFRFKKIPFGLCNAGATFQRLMDLVLSGPSPEICLAYIDDVIIFSSDENSHLERLEAVLSRLTSAG